MEIWRTRWVPTSDEEETMERTHVANVVAIEEAVRFLREHEFLPQGAEGKLNMEDSHGHWFPAPPTEESWNVPVLTIDLNDREDIHIVMWGAREAFPDV